MNICCVYVGLGRDQPPPFYITPRYSQILLITFSLLSKLISCVNVNKYLFRTDEGVYPPIGWADPQGSIAEVQKINSSKEKAYAGEPGSPLSASAVKGETRQSGGTRYEGMKKAI